MLYRDGQTDRWLLGGTWLYRADTAGVGLAEGWYQPGSDTSGWSTTSVPNAYNAGDFSVQSQAGYVGWYRRDFTLPRNAFPGYVPRSARRWIVRFESVNYYATVWLNGQLIGSHAGANLPFEFGLPEQLKSGVNTLVVRVDNRTDASAVPPGPGSNWWNFGGLLREVYLRAVARADIENVRIRTLVPRSATSATVQEQATIRNLTGSSQAVRLTGAYGGARLDFGSRTIPAHASWTASAQATISRPRLWAPDSPALYKATVTLADARGRALGGYLDYSGIRTISVTRSGRLELNGRLLNLRGVDLHVQNITTGAALTSAQYVQLIDWVRRLGAKVIRAHYPVGPQLEELADRYGILIWSEIPAWGPANSELSSRAWVAEAHRMLSENIDDNQNHPSILVWSIGNELPTPATSAEATYIRTSTALVHRLDPTRPAAMAIANWPGVSCQPAYAPLQVIGDNEYFGWFDAGGGGNDDRSALGPYLNRLRACYPHQALMITEFGFDANRHGPVEERGTYEFQSNSVAYHLGVFATKHWLSGAMYFTLQEYAAYPGYSGGNPYPNPPFNQKGLVDLDGHLKPAFSVVARIYKRTRQIGP